MARQLRIEYEHAFYHVIARGERKEAIFACPEDKEKFLKKLAETVEKYKLFLHAYVLMDNHFHLLLETPHANLSKAMHHLNTSYANWFRFKYRLVGSVFQGRFKAILVEKDEYLQVLSAYIHLNPMRAGIIKRPEEFHYSSYRAYIGKVRIPEFLYGAEIMSAFSNNPETYRRFVSSFPDAGGQLEREEVYGVNALLGCKRFIRQAYEKVEAAAKIVNDREQWETRSLRKVDVHDVFESLLVDMRIPEDEIWSRRHGNIYRKLLVHGLRKYTEESLREIGVIMKMDYAAVSAMSRRFAEEIETKKTSRKLWKRLAACLAERQLRKD
jgi:REP element-mobilizing transposase RayT